MSDRHLSIDVISSQPNWSEMEEIKFCNLSAEFCLKLTGARRPNVYRSSFFASVIDSLAAGIYQRPSQSLSSWEILHLSCLANKLLTLIRVRDLELRPGYEF